MNPADQIRKRIAEIKERTISGTEFDLCDALKALLLCLEEVREGNALMAEGEGPYLQVYMDLAKSQMKRTDKVLALAAEILKGKDE